MHTREVTIQPASDVPLPELVRALNLAYADYYVPISHTPGSFEKLLYLESVRLSASAAAVIDHEVVGIGLLGVRGSRGWIGGVGVVPQYRAQGVGRLMMDFLISQGSYLSLQRLQLEVITQNVVAHNLYQSLGFIDQRTLLVLYHTGYQPVPLIQHESPALNMRRVDIGEALTALPALIESSRPWQREIEAMRLMTDRLRALAAQDASGALVGLVIYHAAGEQSGIRDIAATSPEIGEAVLVQFVNSSRNAHISYVNVAAEEPIVPALRRCGFSETLSQYEMFLTLASEAA